MLKRKELDRSEFQRNAVWTTEDDITFINGLLSHGCFNSIILIENDHFNLSIIDGQQRLNALSRILSCFDSIRDTSYQAIYFDLLNGCFDNSVKSTFHITTVDLIKGTEIDHFQCRSFLSQPGISDDQREKCGKNLDALYSFFHLQVPVYIYQADKSDSFPIFEILNELGLPLDKAGITICPYGNPVCNKEYSSISDKLDLNTPTENTFISNHSVRKTDFQPFLGVVDIDVAVMTGPQEIINIMAIDREEILHTRNEIITLYYKYRGHCTEIIRNLIEEKSIPVLSSIEDIKEFDEEALLKSPKHLIL